ncbi:hypothetical protein XA68_17865 [Ophiocordyceps unilateralis]|uniref:Uncharacterized protein n=1 Tax=Ophiocordyceps unilateralis TaxID=268505 RepID=A0A2A9P2V6_OPHUN|nr:hypothetical protein XA68_17865 [Ophiocordyceps unilateralis]
MNFLTLSLDLYAYTLTYGILANHPIHTTDRISVIDTLRDLPIPTSPLRGSSSPRGLSSKVSTRPQTLSLVSFSLSLSPYSSCTILSFFPSLSRPADDTRTVRLPPSPAGPSWHGTPFRHPAPIPAIRGKLNSTD